MTSVTTNTTAASQDARHKILFARRIARICIVQARADDVWFCKKDI